MIYVNNTVSRRLNILCIHVMFNIIVFFIITVFAGLYVRVGILLTHGKHLHDRIISLERDVWSNNTNLILPPFYCARTNQWKWTVIHLCCMCLYFASFYDCSIGFWNCSDSLLFSVFHLVVRQPLHGLFQ